MLKRKMLDKLIAWKQKAGGREALLIEGARRVGKSTIVEEFGRTQYKSYILIDFTRLPRDVRDIFENQRDDFDTFFMLLSAYYRKRLYERESLIISTRCSGIRRRGSSSNIWLRMAGMTMWKLVR